jgi:hypothetical protein
MRTIEVRCNACGVTIPAKPATLWTLDDEGTPRRTGPLDFCSLPCVARWAQDDEVRAAYPADFAPAVRADGLTPEESR